MSRKKRRNRDYEEWGSRLNAPAPRQSVETWREWAPRVAEAVRRSVDGTVESEKKEDVTTKEHS